MNSYDLSRTDSLHFSFNARGNPLDEGGAEVERFLEVLEAHAGELMPTIVHGRRDREYSRAAFAKAYAEARDFFLDPDFNHTPPALPDGRF